MRTSKTHKAHIRLKPHNPQPKGQLSKGNPYSGIVICLWICAIYVTSSFLEGGASIMLCTHNIYSDIFGTTPPRPFLSSSLSSYSRNLDISHNAQLATLKTDIIVLGTASKILVSAHCLTSRLMENIQGVFCFLRLEFDSDVSYDVRFNALPKSQQRSDLVVSSGVWLTIFFDNFLFWREVREQRGKRNCLSECLNVGLVAWIMMYVQTLQLV